MPLFAWGSTYKSITKAVQIKQNHIARIIFFSTLYGKNTESPLPIINLLNILTIDHIYVLQALKLIHNWHKQKLPSILKKVISSTQKIFTHITQDMPQKTIYTNLVIEQIPVNKRYMQWQQTYGKNYLPTLNT